MFRMFSKLILSLRSLVFLIVLGLVGTGQASAADIQRALIMEFDPLAPASALVDEADDTTASKWGVNADFNVVGRVATGPEFWTGTFSKKGSADNSVTTRREDMQMGEKHRIEGTRLRWTVAFFQNPSSMRGWYLRTGYSYTRVNSRANRLSEETPSLAEQAPSDETDIVTDTRHGVVVGFGQRWTVFSSRASITIGLSYDQDFKRSVNVDSKDPMARKDYDEMIESIPDSRLSVRPLPEAHLNIGYVF